MPSSCGCAGSSDWVFCRKSNLVRTSLGLQQGMLYKVFVKQRKDADRIAVTYPRTVYKVSPPRRSVLYYISGWLLSKAWTHQRRHNLRQPEWWSMVRHNHSGSNAAAIRLDPVLADLVGLVEARNDTVRGTGLLFPTLAWYEFIFFVVNGFYHIVQDLYFLEAYLGDLPAEILRVVSESAVVKEAWAACCPAACDLPPFEADSSVLDEVFAFAIQKFLRVRLGDYAHRKVSTLSLSKGEPALRQ
ncbi:unnamed protein product [Pylaiella littoralis]